MCCRSGKPIAVGTGSYDYSLQTELDYRTLYDGNIAMERLLADQRAVNILVVLADEVGQSTSEAMPKSLLDM